MAKVIKTKGKNKFLAALGGAAKGVETGIDLGIKLKNAETQRGFLKAQMDSLDLKKAQEAEKVKGLHGSALIDIVGQAVETDDPKGLIKFREKDIRRHIIGSGRDTTFESVSEMAMVKNEKATQAARDFRQAKNTIFTMNPNTASLDDLKRAQKKAQDAMQRWRGIPEISSANKKFLAGELKELDKIVDTRQKQFVKIARTR